MSRVLTRASSGIAAHCSSLAVQAVTTGPPTASAVALRLVTQSRRRALRLHEAFIRLTSALRATRGVVVQRGVHARGASARAGAMKLPENYVAGGRTRKATAMGGFGQGMLEKMGWRNGEGLGKERQGRAAPVEVTKKDDTKGLGGRFDWDWSHDYAASAFDNALAAIGGGNDSGDSSSSSSSSGSSSDDECAARNADGTASSASAAELRLARDLAKGNNLGRFGGRAGKLARVREQEARLAAAASQPGPLQGKGAAAAPPVAAARQAAPQPRGLIITVRGEELKMPSKPPKAQPASWWGHAAFRSAGWLHGLQEELRAATEPRDRGFSEETQVSLYNRLQAQQSKVRRRKAKAPPLLCCRCAADGGRRAVGSNSL